MNGYELSRNWFDWCFENPEKITPNHTAIYFFAIEHCNRLGWKEKFGFPTQMTMDAIGIKKHQTYIKYFNELVEWGFIKLVQKSQNQYSANIICLQSAKPKTGKALDKANINHTAKQTQKQLSSIGQSNSTIDKPLTINNKPITNNQLNKGEGIFTIKDSVFDIPVSEWFKKNFMGFFEQWKMKNKDPIEFEVLEKMDTDYFAYTFTDHNHVQNAFKTTWKKIINEKKYGISKSNNTNERQASLTKLGDAARNVLSNPDNFKLKTGD